MRIALAQVNATVGDLAGNADLIVAWTRRAADQGARLVVFPEMMLTGYPVEDLALRASFVAASTAALRATAERLAAEGLGGIAVVTGYLDHRPDLAPRVGLPAGAPLDAAALLYDGAVAVRSAKHHLPNYGVFDEYRYFVPGDTLPVFRMPAGGGQSVDVAIAICEDLWQDGGPVTAACAAGAGLLVVPNASPYESGKDDTRLELLPAAGARGGRRAGVREHGGRPGRTRVRRRLDPGGRRGAAAGPRAAVRGRPGRRGPGPAGRERGPEPGRDAGRREGRLGDHHPAAGAGRRGQAGPGARRRRPGHVAPAARPRRGVRGPGHRRPRLRAEEPVQLGDPGPVGRDRLGPDRDDRGRRGGPGPGARGAHAEPLLVGPLRHRRRGPGQAPGRARQDGADPVHGRRVRGGARPLPAWPRRTCRPGSAAWS